MSKLAINGGSRIREKIFPKYITLGSEEEEAVKGVIQTGVLSHFLGAWHKNFYGGPQIQALESEWAKYFGAKHAISVNSATSGLYCAVGATGSGPGDEIIVSPYTMSASATAPLIYNSIPVFADIEEEFFCLDPESIRSQITPRTKAIIVVDLFGQPYNKEEINKIARDHDLLVIEDAAQAPGAKYGEKFAGTLGDIGIFSLNCHKHIQTGEGGIIVTNDDDLAEKMQLIRNHAEAVLANKEYTTLVNMIGFNLRMTEIDAAIGRTQLKKLSSLFEKRQKNLEYFVQGIKSILFLHPALTRENCLHAFYMHPIKFNQTVAGVTREKFINAVSAELSLEKDENLLMRISNGYVKPLYLQPIFQNLIAYGSQGCPFKCPWYDGQLNYNHGLCPTTEKLHYNELFGHSFMHPDITRDDLDDVISAFLKVEENINELK